MIRNTMPAIHNDVYIKYIQNQRLVSFDERKTSEADFERACVGLCLQNVL